MTDIRSALEMKSTVELDARLRAELLKESADGDLVRQILRILEDREKDYQIEVMPQTQAAWGRFRDHGRADRPWQTARNWVVRAASMAAVLCLLLLAVLPQPVKADTWWERFARWTESVFEFSIDGKADDEKPEYVFKTDNPGLQEVYDAVTELGVTVPVVPMWLPEGYELVSCEKMNSSNSNIFSVFSNGESELVFRVYLLNSDTGNKYQKDKNEVIKYEVGGISHNMMWNKNSRAVAWMNDNIECMLLADFREDVLHKVIWSIYTTEDFL